MDRDQMESAFSAFLDSKDYDKGEEALFALARMAFTAGWMAASPAPQA